MPGEFVPQRGPVGMSMASPTHPPPPKAPRLLCLSHRAPRHPPTRSAMLMHGDPPSRRNDHDSSDPLTTALSSIAAITGGR
uniref:Uncharacterized protein n=1 Tax=Sinocyclocheilus anshuiensis TaxID=1608454 RepID=A0A671SJ25_9TELE